MIDILLALAALWLLCRFLTVCCRVPAALAPLAGLSLAALWLTLAGMAGLLRPGAAVLYLACLAGGAVSLKKSRPGSGQTALQCLITPGSTVFWALSLAFAVYFCIRQPLFADFDEFSFWGTAAKLTCINNALYTTGEIGWAWQATQNPGLIVLGYFFQVWGSFAPWKIFLAYDVLLFACFAAVIGGTRWKNYALAVPAAAICWCVPWFFTTYNRTIYNAISTVYMSSYGDIPAGVVFGGAVAYWLWLRRSAGQKWTVLPVLALCGNIKSNTFVLSLVAAGLVAADCVLFVLGGQKGFAGWKHGLAKRFGFALGCMAAPLALYLGWNSYIARLVAQNAAAGGMGTTSESIVTVALSGVKILLGLPVGDYYTQRLPRLAQAGGDMQSAFYHTDISMLGPGVMLAALTALLLLGTVLLAKGERLRMGALGVLSAGGFVGYNFMLVLSYAFIFKESQCADLVDYNRYLYTYYIGWFLLAVAALVYVLDSRESLLPQLGRGVVWLLAVVMLWRVNQLVLPQMSVLGFSSNYFSEQRLQQARADAARAVMQPGSRVFFVSQGDNGYYWFSYSYDFLPTVVDYSGNMEQGGGGGTFGLPQLRPGEEDHNRYLYYHPYTAGQWRQEVLNSGCDYIFLNEIDEIFIQSYAELFSDGLAAARGGETLVYQVENGGFTPVAMEVPR